MAGFVGLVQLKGAPIPENLRNNFLLAACEGGNYLLDSYLSPAQDVAIWRLHRGILNSQPQPVRSPDGRLFLFLDGEVFNEDLDLSDQAGSILKAYLQEGEALFTRLNGSFELALIESGSHRLTMVCDRSASLPLFYRQADSYLLFSSRLKPFAALPDIHQSVNLQALANFLACGYLLDGESLLNGVKLLGPGQMLTADRQGISVRNDWNFTFTPNPEARDEQAFSQELADLVFRAIERRTREDAQFGVLLSGGYDSRVIAGCLRKLKPERPFRTITWGEDEQRPDSDAAVAGLIARHLHAQHAFFKLDAAALPQHFRSFVVLSEGRTDAVGNYPEALRIFESIARDLKVDVVLRGDECFGWKEDVSREAEMLHSLSIHDMACLPGTYEYLQPRIRRQLDEASHAQIARLMRNRRYQDLHDQKDYLYFTQRLFGYLNPLSQLKQIVLNLRNPFLDNDILDFVGLLPTRLRLGKALFKTTARRLFPEFESYGFAKYTSLIDWNERLGRDAALQAYIREVLLDRANGFDELVDRRKLRQSLERAFAEAVNNSGLHKGNRLSPYQRLRRRIQRRRGYYDIRPCTQIFRLMIVKLWADEYLRGDFRLA